MVTRNTFHIGVFAYVKYLNDKKMMEGNNIMSYVRGNDALFIVTVTTPIIENGTPVKSGDEIEYRRVDFLSWDDYSLRAVRHGGIKKTIVAESSSLVENEEGQIAIDIPYTAQCGTYSLELIGKQNGRHERSYEIMMFEIVESNDKANVTFDIIEGYKSTDLNITVQMVSSALVYGENAYQMWKHIAGNENKTLQDYIDEVLNMNAATIAAIEAAAEAHAAAGEISHPDYVGEDNYVYHWDSTNNSYVRTDIYVKGETGATGEQGQQGAQGPAGQDGRNGVDGVGIANIRYKSTDLEGNRIYTIVLTNNNTYDFVAPRGEAGQDGTNGINGINGTDGADGADGITPSIDPTSKHWMIGGTDTGVIAQGQSGANGTDGASVESILYNKTDSNGNYVYTVMLTNGNKYSLVCPKGPAGTTNYNELENRPTIPVVPTNLSDFINDMGFLTQHQNLKTINEESIVGIGNIDIQGGGGQAWTVQTSNLSSLELEPYTFYILGEKATLEISVGAAYVDGKLNEYMFQFDSPADTPTVLSIPASLYCPPSLYIEKGKRYIFHIIGNYVYVSGGVQDYDYQADLAAQILSRTAIYLNVPVGVSVIEQYQFSNFTRLQEITLPSTITSIGNYAFQNCSALLGIVIPENVTTIGTYAFLGCSSLISAQILGSITAINGNLFQGCSSLQSIIIPDTVKSIGASAFNGCTHLESIELPSLLNSIGQDAFYNCQMLESIDLPSGFTSLNRAFYNCYELESIDLPATVNTLTGAVFQNCRKLSQVIIRGNVTTLQSSCFQNTALTDFPQTQGTVTTVQGSCFAGNQYLVDFHFPEGVTIANGSCFDGCPQLRSVTLPTTMVNFGANYVFRNCPNMRLLTVHDSITTLNVHSSSSFLKLRILGTSRVISLPTSLNANAKVYVDDSMVAAYKANSSWSATASRIYGLSEYVDE